MSTLDRIISAKREEAAALRLNRSPSSFRDEPAFHAPVRPFARALSAGPGPAVIAEIKRSSPSAGVINASAGPPAIAAAYREHGASAISVLTDGRWFSGSGADLGAVRSVVDLPLLRKDFIVDPIQVHESKALGADAVLLIASVLGASGLRDLHALAAGLGMECLVEVHDEAELGMLDFGIVRMVGINNRNLHDMTIDLETTPRIASLLPPGVTIVSESGLRSAADVRRMFRAGARAVLMGEALMKSSDPGLSLRNLLRELREN